MSRLPADLIRIGTSSFSEPDWVGPFYPKGTKAAEFLTYYAGRYDTVEIDETYYAVPAKSTVDGLAHKTPDNFVIAAKFPKSIVHCGDGPTPDREKILVPEETYGIRDSFLENMSRLGKRLGPLLIQFPYLNKSVFPKREEFMARLDRFLGDLPKEFRYAVEIRNRHWLSRPYAELLKKHNVALVLVDQGWMPHGDEMADILDPMTSDFVYIRLLGDRQEIEKITTSWEKEVIDRGESLARWADLITGMIEAQMKTLVYVNNHYAGHAPTTVERLFAMIEARR